MIVAVASAGTADARRVRQSIQLRIGRDTTRTLAVRRIVNLGAGALGVTILDEVHRYRPSFRFTGDRSLVDRLEKAVLSGRRTGPGSVGDVR